MSRIWVRSVREKTFSDWDWELISFDADPTFFKRGMMEEEKASFLDRHPEYRYRINYFGTAFILYGNIKTMTNLLQNVGSGSRMSQSVLGIRIRIRCIRLFLGHPDPDPLVRDMDPAPDPSLFP
jgi:hypothetical protein